MRFKILYIIGVICWIVYPVQFLFGLPVTPRQLMAIVLFFACMVEDNRIFWSDKHFAIYFVYIFFYWLSTIAEGYAIEGLRRIIGDFFVAYVAYWSTKILCVKYKSVDILVYTIVSLGVLDAAVTACQVFHWNVFDGFLDAFQLISYEPLKDVEYSNRDMMGLAIAGIMSSPVANGHFLMLAVILSLYLCKKGINLPAMILYVGLIVGSFLAQLRTSFFLAVALSIIVLYKIIVSKRTTLTIALEVVFFVLVVYVGTKLYGIISSGTNRYAELGMQLNDRDVIYSTAWEFIGEHPLFGYYNTFVDFYKMYPHNFFLNAYLHAGFFGFIAIMILVVRQLFVTVKNIVVKSDNSNNMLIVFSAAFIGLFGNGMTHNISLASGDVMTWLVWAALVYAMVANTKETNLNHSI